MLEEIERRIVGLRRETEVLVTALRAERHVVLEGPPGTGKSTLLRAVADAFGWGMEFVEGNAELTPARLVGSHDPAIVLERGYVDEAFTEGPLATAMRAGALLYVEELNRVPEETLNVLITALAEGEIHVPRLGPIHAHDRFRLIAAMNPFDAIGTARVGQAIYDRMCRIAIGYQDEAAEVRIVKQLTGQRGELVALAVAVARATRAHPALRTGSSVRGAVDMVLLAQGLGDLRGEPAEALTEQTLLDAALAAFSGRIRLEEGSAESPENLVTALLARLLEERARAKKASAPPAPEQVPAGRRGTPASASRPPAAAGRPRRALEGEAAREAVREASRRTASRRALTRAHPALERISPAVGVLDEAQLSELLEDDQEAGLALLTDLAAATDPALRAQARRAAARVFVRMAARGQRRGRGARRLGSVPAGLGDVDLDRTLERSGGRRPRRGEELVTRGWQAAPRALCLLVDRSGSMKGGAVAMAAMAAAAVVIAARGRAQCSVVAFSDRPVVLQGHGERRSPADLVDELLTLRGRGTTDLSSALACAASQLARAGNADAGVVLMSDCLHTAGADPLDALAGIERLHVLCTSDEGDSVRAARLLAARGGGSHVVVTSAGAVAEAMTTLLSG